MSKLREAMARKMCGADGMCVNCMPGECKEPKIALMAHGKTADAALAAIEDAGFVVVDQSELSRLQRDAARAVREANP